MNDALPIKLEECSNNVSEAIALVLAARSDPAEGVKRLRAELGSNMSLASQIFTAEEMRVLAYIYETFDDELFASLRTECDDSSLGEDHRHGLLSRELSCRVYVHMTGHFDNGFNELIEPLGGAGYAHNIERTVANLGIEESIGTIAALEIDYLSRFPSRADLDAHRRHLEEKGKIKLTRSFGPKEVDDTERSQVLVLDWRDCRTQAPLSCLWVFSDEPLPDCCP